MIQGVVTDDGTPIVILQLFTKRWVAIIDTGFNGDLELPDLLRKPLKAKFAQVIISSLAGGQQVVENAYWVKFPFDGRKVTAVATFVPGDEILIGTGLLADFRLEIDFPNKLVRIEQYS